MKLQLTPASPDRLSCHARPRRVDPRFQPAAGQWLLTFASGLTSLSAYARWAARHAQCVITCFGLSILLRADNLWSICTRRRGHQRQVRLRVNDKHLYNPPTWASWSRCSCPAPGSPRAMGQRSGAGLLGGGAGCVGDPSRSPLGHQLDVPVVLARAGVPARELARPKLGVLVHQFQSGRCCSSLSS
jgi:hypothetical protein